MDTSLEFTFSDGRRITRLGYGAMRLTGQPGNYGPYADWQGGVELLRHAHNLGAGHIDTARAYGPHFNERLIGEAFAYLSAAERPFIASKGGIEKTGAGGQFIRADGRPEALRQHIEESLSSLQVDQLDLYYLHRPDPAVPIEDSVGALADALARGEIARIGVSNVTLEELKRAQTVAPIAAVQNRYNPAEGGDDAVLDYTTRHAIAFVPWGPLAARPLEHGAPLAVGETAENGLTPAQRTLRALLERAPNILPIPGTTSAHHLAENLAAIAAPHHERKSLIMTIRNAAIAGMIALALALGAAPAVGQTPMPDPLNQMRAEHVMISVDDYDETIAWYRDTLGFEPIHQWTVPEFPGVRLAYLERNGFVIEVVETPQARSKREKPTDLALALRDRGIGHFAFLVPDVDAVADELEKRGAHFLLRPTSFPASGRRLIFITDNNGNVIEFLTPLSAYSEEPNDD